MSATPGPDDAVLIGRIREAWGHFDGTGDARVIEDYLADDIVLMPPGAPAMTGKPEILQGGAAAAAYDIDRTSEGLFVSGDLAVDRIRVTGTRNPDSRGVSDEVSLKGLDIYRRDRSGGWECIIAIWNNRG